MAIPENLLKAYVKSQSGDGPAIEFWHLSDFITDLESFTEVFNATESEKTRVIIAGEYPELYLEYSKEWGLVEDEED